MIKREYYDILLVHMFSRTHSYYINIIKSLSKDFKIGVYYMNCVEESHRRNQIELKNTDDLYFELYSNYGAELLSPENKYSCNLLLLPQYSFDSDEINSINYSKIVLLAFYSFGAYLFKDFKNLGGKKVFVYAKNIFDDIVKFNKEEKIVNTLDIKEFIPPYRDHPALDYSDKGIDYIIAYPSQLFLNEKIKFVNLLKNIKNLIKLIPDDKRIYLKPHNVTDFGNKWDNLILQNSNYTFFKIILMGIKIIAKCIIRKNVNVFEEFLNIKLKYLMDYINKNSISLSSFSKYHNFNIEHFLPFVKEGVITGISTVILIAYYNRLSVYNCDDQLLITEKSRKYHEIKNYYLPFCGGQLNFDNSNFNRVKQTNHDLDLIELIKNEII